MTARRLYLASLVLASSSLAAVGCAAPVDADVDEVLEADEAELNAAGRALIGSYKVITGRLYGLVLTSERVGQRNRFFADVDTGIRCVTTPCPSEERVEGTFSAGAKTLTLRSTTASNRVAAVLGTYRYTRSGDVITLTKSGARAMLEASGTYCSEATDCGRQSFIHPMCVGEATCSAHNTCGWNCGQSSPPSPVACFSSGSCLSDEYCTTEDGVCNSSGMLTVCSGTCEKGLRQ